MRQKTRELTPGFTENVSAAHPGFQLIFSTRTHKETSLFPSSWRCPCTLRGACNSAGFKWPDEETVTRAGQSSLLPQGLLPHSSQVLSLEPGAWRTFRTLAPLQISSPDQLLQPLLRQMGCWRHLASFLWRLCELLLLCS